MIIHEGKPLAYYRRVRAVEPLKRLFPGILLCIAITLAAMLMERLEIFLIDQRYLEALVLALLLGVAVRTAWKPGSIWNDGINFSAKFVLEFAIVLLGASVSVTMVAALGSLLILGIACIVTLAIGASYLLSRALGLPRRMAILIACGNSICGNSAIAAVAPVIGAAADDIASSISFTAVLGVVVVLGLPLLVSTIWRARRADRVRGPASSRGDIADRGVEQSGRYRHQARPRADAGARRARACAAGTARQTCP